MTSDVEELDISTPEKMQKHIEQMDATHLWVQMHISLGTAQALSLLFENGWTPDYQAYLVNSNLYWGELYRAEGIKRGIDAFEQGGAPIVVN